MSDVPSVSSSPPDDGAEQRLVTSPDDGLTPIETDWALKKDSAPASRQFDVRITNLETGEPDGYVPNQERSRDDG